MTGDFNNDGLVDAADYTVWRDGLGSVFDADDYHVWKQNFGATAASVATLGPSSHAAVPEPSSLLLVVVAAMLMLLVCGTKVGEANRGAGSTGQGVRSRE